LAPDHADQDDAAPLSAEQAEICAGDDPGCRNRYARKCGAVLEQLS